jgi:hypothetical protein
VLRIQTSAENKAKPEAWRDFPDFVLRVSAEGARHCRAPMRGAQPKILGVAFSLLIRP